MKRLRLISTILVPSAKGERIVKFRQYTGGERETGLGVNMYDFCGGDPVNLADPVG